MISLIIPTYRNPKYLDICLRSAVGGRVNENNEIIVVVDGFVEESKEVLDKMLAYIEKKYISVPMKMAKQIFLEK